MDWNTFRMLVADGEFFRFLDDPVRPEAERSRVVDWLRFLKTESIRGWFQGGPRARGGDRAIRWPSDERILALLLERQLLNGVHRTEPQPLLRFWRWATRDWPELADVWREDEIIDTLNASTRAEQEVRFARLLDRCSNRLAVAPEVKWAHRTVARLAADWCPDRAHRAVARVVFAWQRPMPEPFRPVVVVDFELHGAAERGNPCSHAEVFDDRFRESLGYVQARVGDSFRCLEHDWGFVGEELLAGSSGTMALLLAQKLSTRGWFGAGYWSLPPWVVITATLDRCGPAPGGTAAPVDLLEQKAALLLEEGVRVMVTAPEAIDESADGTARGLIPNCPEAEFLRQYTFEGGVEKLAGELKTAGYLRPVQLQPPRPLVPAGHERGPRRRRGHRLHFHQAGYVPPDYFFRALVKCLGELPGRGCIHMTAPEMMGKSVAIWALADGLPGKPAEIGPTLVHSVLFGHPESPVEFLESIRLQIFDAVPPEHDALRRELLQIDPARCDSVMAVRELLIYLLKRLREACPSDRAILLVLDGLDEITLRESVDYSWRIDDQLPSPLELPVGCYVVLTSRPELRDSLRQQLQKWQVEAPEMYRHVQLDDRHADYHAVLTDFLVKAHGEAVRRHVPQVLKQARYQFLRVRWLSDLLPIGLNGKVLEDVPEGRLEIPLGDEALPVWLDWLAQRVAGGREAFARWHRRVLALMAAAYTPVTRGHLRHWLAMQMNEPGADEQLNVTLDELKPLLSADTAQHDEDTEYRLAHVEIREWLRSTRHPAWCDAIKTDGHEAIVRAAAARGIVAADARLQTDRLGEEGHAVVEYSLLHLPSHHLDLDDPKSAWATLSNLELVKELFDLTQRQHDQWEHARELDVWSLRISQVDRLVHQLGGFAAAREFDISVLNYMAVTYLNRGKPRERQEDYDRAVADYDAGIALLEQLETSLGGRDAVVRAQPALSNNLAVVYMNRGSARRGQQEYDRAVSDYDAAIAILEQLQKSLGGRDAVVRAHRDMANDLAAAYASRGNARQGQQEYDRAVADYDAAIEILEQLQQSLGGRKAVVRAQQALANDLAAAYISRGEAWRGQQEYDRAVPDYDAAITILEQLQQSLGGRDAVVRAQPALANDLAQAYMNRGNARQGQQEYDRAVSDYDAAIAIFEQLQQSLGGRDAVVRAQPALAKGLAKAYMNRGTARLRQQEYDRAVADYDAAIEILEQLLPGLRQYVLGDLLMTYGNRLRFCLARSDMEGTSNTLRRAVVATIVVYRQVGRDIAVPLVRRESDWLRILLAKPEMLEAVVPEELRPTWDELREVLA